MQEINETRNGNIDIRQDVTLNGEINGNVTVHEGNTFIVRGIIKGNLINEGGQVEIYGTVYGSIRRHAGETMVDVSAHVNQ